MDYPLRKATIDDLPRIIELNGLLADHHHALDPYWRPGTQTKASFAAFAETEITRPEALWLVAEGGNSIVGYFSAEIQTAKPHIAVSKIGHISGGFILEEYRGKGIAKRAVAMICDWFREQGASVAELTVDSRNSGGVKAWESLGFKEHMKRMKMDL